jgi:hypothetical protein
MSKRTGAGAVASVTALAALSLVACGRSAARTSSPTGIADPRRSVAARPDYRRACSVSGVDRSLPCIQVSLAAVNHARAQEGVRPMALPANFADLTVPEQLLVAVDRERVDRGLPPFVGLSEALGDHARKGAAAGDVPADPGPPWSAVDTEWIGGVANGLDADYAWMYDDGPAAGAAGCRHAGDRGCWADRHIVLDDFGAGVPVMGAFLDPAADRSADDRGGPSLAAVLAGAAAPPADLTYTWERAVTDTAAGSITPRVALPANASATHIADPARTVPPDPDYVGICAGGVDESAPCLSAALEAVNHARAAEGVKPMVLTPGFERLGVPEQVLVVVNLERVDRGLAPFVGRTDELDANARKGAVAGDDPPDPGPRYQVVDTIWAGGSSNGLDAAYGWMYDDGPGSTNLDCPKTGGSGCWGHRHAILDDFGSVGTLVMGAAVDLGGDAATGDRGGTSIAATLGVVPGPPPSYSYTWEQALGTPP